MLGISQPQVHNVLKGVRKLSPEIADLILAKLNLSILDLFTEVELSARVTAPERGLPKKPPQLDLSWKRLANGTTD